MLASVGRQPPVHRPESPVVVPNRSLRRPSSPAFRGRRDCGRSAAPRHRIASQPAPAPFAELSPIPRRPGSRRIKLNVKLNSSWEKSNSYRLKRFGLPEVKDFPKELALVVTVTFGGTLGGGAVLPPCALLAAVAMAFSLACSAASSLAVGVARFSSLNNCSTAVKRSSSCSKFPVNFSFEPPSKRCVLELRWT